MLFFEVKSPTEARRLLDRPAPPPAAESVSLPDALGRVLAADVRSPIDLPEFDRSVVDGFAVRAADTFGASPGRPAYLRVRCEVLMGQGTDLVVGVGEAARIATGGMLPREADAVAMPVDRRTGKNSWISLQGYFVGHSPTRRRVAS